MTPSSPDTTSRRGLVVGLALGAPVAGYGVWGALHEAARVHPPELARWVVGAAVLNDLVLLPIVLAAGWVARRRVPAGAWPAVRTGLIVSGVLALVAWPFVRGYGRSPSNPSLFPRNYATGLATALALVWLFVAAWVAVGRWRRRATSRRASTSHRPASTAQDTPTRSTTNTSVSSGPMTPPAPRDP